MNLKKLRSLLNEAKLFIAVGGGLSVIAYAVWSTKRAVSTVVRSRVLDRDKAAPEFIYIDDPNYKQDKDAFGPGNKIRSSVVWRLLWLCKHGDKEYRNIALHQLAAVKNGKDWMYAKIAQALDAETAVQLARTEGADLRYFMRPPMYIRRLAHFSDQRLSRLGRALYDLKTEAPHSCTDNFINKYVTKVKEEPPDPVASSPPPAANDRQLSLMMLDAVHHHLMLTDNNKENVTPAHRATVAVVAELLERFRGDVDIEMCALKVLNLLSARPTLLSEFYINGLLGYLARWIRSGDVRFSCTAATALANLSGDGMYRGGVYLLYPSYRTSERYACDIVFLHGLRGSVFQTWRQRDNNQSTLGILETVLTGGGDSDCDGFSSVKNFDGDYDTSDHNQVMSELDDLEEDALLSTVEVVLHDIPEQAIRERPDRKMELTWTLGKRECLRREKEDRCTYTSCWPKDWLPKDCPHIRVLGVDYNTSVSEWTGACGAAGTIEERAAALQAALLLARVGRAPLVAVAHSMGGLVMERVLLVSARSSEPTEVSLAKSTRALVYYSTPHRGSTLANLPRGAAALVWPSTIVRQLQEGSPSLLALQKEFVALAEQYGWETVCFGENVPTLVSPFKLPIQFVQNDSADLGRGPYYKLPLDHLSICKPSTRQSIIYLTVVDILRQIVEEDEERRRQEKVIAEKFHVVDELKRIWQSLVLFIKKTEQETVGDQLRSDKPVSDQSSSDNAVNDQSSGENAAGHQSTSENAADDQSMSDKSTDNSNDTVKDKLVGDESTSDS